MSAVAVAAYTSVAAHGRRSTAAVAETGELSTAEVDAALAELAALGLISRPPGDGCQLSPLSPTLAALRHVAPWERQLRAQQRQLEELRDQLESLLPAYLESRPSGSHPETVHDDAAARAVLGELCVGCTGELLLCLPATGWDESSLAEPALRCAELVSRGVRVRMLVQHAARYAASTAGSMRRLLPLGVEIRTVASELQWLAVFDDRTAAIPLRDRPEGLVLLNEASVVAFSRSVFEQAWCGGTPCQAETDPQQTVELAEGIKLSIVRLLADGHSDKAIARRLGISERTCQRHIAEVFQRISARSRFHAGYLIHRSGMLSGLEPAGDSPDAEGEAG